MSDSLSAAGDIEAIDRPGERYEILIGNTSVGQLTYRALRSGRRTLAHTEIDPEYRGRGLSNVLYAVRSTISGERRQRSRSFALPFMHSSRDTQNTNRWWTQSFPARGRSNPIDDLTTAREQTRRSEQE